MNTAIVRLVEGILTALIITHIFACFWFMICKFDVSKLRFKPSEFQSRHLGCKKKPKRCFLGNLISLLVVRELEIKQFLDIGQLKLS